MVHFLQIRLIIVMCSNYKLLLFSDPLGNIIVLFEMIALNIKTSKIISIPIETFCTLATNGCRKQNGPYIAPQNRPSESVGYSAPQRLHIDTVSSLYGNS